MTGEWQPVLFPLLIPTSYLPCSACCYDPLLDVPGDGDLGLCVAPRAEAKPGKALDIPAWHCAQTLRIAGTGPTAASSRSRSAGRGFPSARAHSGWLQGGEMSTGHRKALNKSDWLPPPYIQVPDNCDIHASPQDQSRHQKQGSESMVQRQLSRGEQGEGGWGESLLMRFHQLRMEEYVPRAT